MYDLVVWFVDEPAVDVELGLRVQSGTTVTVSCDADFYTCRTEQVDAPLDEEAP